MYKVIAVNQKSQETFKGSSDECKKLAAEQMQNENVLHVFVFNENGKLIQSNSK